MRVEIERRLQLTPPLGPNAEIKQNIMHFENHATRGRLPIRTMLRPSARIVMAVPLVFWHLVYLSLLERMVYFPWVLGLV